MESDFLVPIFLFGGTAVVLWKYFEGHHKERMAMIEKGLNPDQFKSSKPAPIFKSDALSNLKWGLLIAFVGIGIIIGEQLRYIGFNEESSVPASMSIAGGLALIIFYFIASKKMKEKQTEE